MAIYQKYQGDDIKLDIKLKNEDGTFVDLTTYEDIIVYLYTKNNNIAKSSVVEKEGYYKITRIDDYTYELMVPSIFTKTMECGGITIETNFVEDSTNENLTDNRFNNIKIAKDIFVLLPSIIKADS